MRCPHCDGVVVAFDVPPDFPEYAPGESTAICSTCLAPSAVEEPDEDPDFSRIVDSFPSGETGVAMALAAGLIVDSLALNREAVADLFERVQAGGEDPWLVLERLEAAGSVDPDVDLGRARRQLRQLLG